MIISKFANMQITNVIIHQIFKREITDTATVPFYSSACTVLNEVYSTKIKERIVKAMGNQSHSIRMEIVDSGEESAFMQIAKYWKHFDEDSFILSSKKLTKMLADAQNNRRYPGGLIICISGTVQESNKSFYCIIKAEPQDGFSLNKNVTDLKLDYIDDLFMTKNDKFQKMAFFIDNAIKGREVRPIDVDSFIFDSNTDSSIAKSKAEYFYKSFLGLDFRKDSNILTLNFVSHTKRFISELKEINDVEKIKLSSALLSYVDSEALSIINPTDFAKNNFTDPSIVDLYIKYLSENNLDTNSIHKDNSMLGTILKYRKLEFSNKVKLQIPLDEFNDSVEIDKNEKGETVVKIKGTMLGEK